MKLWKKRKSAAVFAAAICAAALAGADLPAVKAGASEGAAMGRYMEQDVTPDGQSYQLYDLRELEDHTLRMLWAGSDRMDTTAWDSSDCGVTWKKAYSVNEILGVSSGYCASAAIAPDGSTFLCLGQEDAPGDARYRYVKIAPDGSFSDVPLDIPEMEMDETIADIRGYLSELRYTENGKITTCLLGFGDRLYQYDDTTGELLRTYNEDEIHVGYFQKVDDDLILYGYDGVFELDYETGEYIEKDTVLKETIEADESNLAFLNSNTYPLVMCTGGREGELYYATAGGIFHYQRDGSVVEQLVDGTLTSLSRPSAELISLLAPSDGSLLAAVRDDNSIRLLRYVYDETAPAVPDTEIRVYSLEENKEVQQAVSLFQTRYPQYYVTYEIGMTGSDAVTSSDALRTLNTEIMAGNGPDVLIMDGMPVKSYAERGILQDMSGLLGDADIMAGLFGNIAGIYETDGALYALPSRFQVPVLVGGEDALSQITDLTSLADTAERLREEDGAAAEILGFDSIYWSLRAFFSAYSPAMTKEDGSLNEEAVSAFITQMKRLLDLNQYQEEERSYRYMTVMGENQEGYDFTTTISAAGFLLNEQKMEQSSLASGFTLAELITIAPKEQLDYIASPYAGAHVFVPTTIAGISSQSSQTEGAGEFVKFLLSQEAQSSNQGSGFPVNREAFETEIGADSTEALASMGYTMADENGEYVDIEYDIMGLTTEQKETFRTIVENLDTPSITDYVIRDLVVEQAGECLAGNLSVEDAVSAINQKMSLYLAE